MVTENGNALSLFGELELIEEARVATKRGFGRLVVYASRVGHQGKKHVTAIFIRDGDVELRHRKVRKEVVTEPTTVRDALLNEIQGRIYY